MTLRQKISSSDGFSVKKQCDKASSHREHVMYCISTDQVRTVAPPHVSPRLTPVLDQVPQSTFPQSFLCGFYEARCWTQRRPCQGRVHETGISWSITGFHFNKLAPNYPSIIVPGHTDVFGRSTRSLYRGLTHGGHFLSLWLYTWNVFKGRSQMASQIKMNVTRGIIYLVICCF